eukprot:scaffold1874_cov89-Skeletonema_dohrnii-CCMP3373.AAC.2
MSPAESASPLSQWTTITMGNKNTHLSLLGAGLSTFSGSAAVVFFLGNIVMSCFAEEKYDK